MKRAMPLEKSGDGVVPPGGACAQVTVPVLKEELRIGTRTVHTGKGVRIRKSVSERPYEIEETLIHEEIEVRHVPVDCIVSLDEAPASRYEGDTLIVPVTEEVMVIERRLRIREELHIIRKKREQHYADTVWLRLEEVSIEPFDEAADRESGKDKD